MKVSVIGGAGYVGLITALGSSSMGHDVISTDIDEKKVKNLNNNIPPIYEESLGSLLKFCNLNMRYGGCAALDLAYVASGRLDGFFHNKINIWDVAAGALLVQEAGGIVNNLNEFSQNSIDIRASSAAINDKMLENLENF